MRHRDRRLIKRVGVSILNTRSQLLRKLRLHVLAYHCYSAELTTDICKPFAGAAFFTKCICNLITDVTPPYVQFRRKGSWKRTIKLDIGLMSTCIAQKTQTRHNLLLRRRTPLTCTITSSRFNFRSTIVHICIFTNLHNYGKLC